MSRVSSLQILLVRGCSAGSAGRSPRAPRAGPTRPRRSSRVFIIPPIIVAIIGELASGRRRPDRRLRSARATSSTGRTRRSSASIPDSPVVASLDLPGWTYLAAAAVGIVRSIGARRSARYLTGSWQRPTTPPTVPALELDHVSRWYGNVVAVNDISFGLGAGVTGLLGPNGAGKSTLLHLMAGLLAPSAGRVRVGGPHRVAATRDVPRTSGSCPSARPSIRT